MAQVYPFVIYMFLPQRSTSCTGTCINDPQQGTWDENFSCAATCAAGSSTDANMRLFMISVENTLGSANVRLYYRSGSDAGCPSGCAGEMYMTQAQMNKLRAVTTPGGTTNPGGTALQVHTPIPATTPGTCTYSSTCGAQVRTVIKTHVLTRKWIVHVLDPTVVPNDPATPTTFTVLQPQPNETYTDYIARLQDAGWVGTATQITEPTAVDGYGPNAPTRVQYVPTGSSTTTTLDPLNWPNSPPAMHTDTPITIRVNTPTAIPPGAGGGTCSCPPVNIDPLKAITVGTSFPFGAFTWFQTMMGSPTATNLDFTLHLPIGDTDVNTQSTWWEDNRDTYYPIEEFLITVAFFFVFAKRILGMGKADDE